MANIPIVKSKMGCTYFKSLFEKGFNKSPTPDGYSGRYFPLVDGRVPESEPENIQCVDNSTIPSVDKSFSAYFAERLPNIGRFKNSNSRYYPLSNDLRYYSTNDSTHTIFSGEEFPQENSLISWLSNDMPDGPSRITDSEFYFDNECSDAPGFSWDGVFSTISSQLGNLMTGLTTYPIMESESKSIVWKDGNGNVLSPVYYERSDASSAPITFGSYSHLNTQDRFIIKDFASIGTSCEIVQENLEVGEYYNFSMFIKILSKDRIALSEFTMESDDEYTYSSNGMVPVSNLPDHYIRLVIYGKVPDSGKLKVKFSFDEPDNQNSAGSEISICGLSFSKGSAPLDIDTRTAGKTHAVFIGADSGLYTNGLLNNSSTWTVRYTRHYTYMYSKDTEVSFVENIGNLILGYHGNLVQTLSSNPEGLTDINDFMNHDEFVTVVKDGNSIKVYVRNENDEKYSYDITPTGGTFNGNITMGTIDSDPLKGQRTRSILLGGYNDNSGFHPTHGKYRDLIILLGTALSEKDINLLDKSMIAATQSTIIVENTASNAWNGSNEDGKNRTFIKDEVIRAPLFGEFI